MTILTGKAVNPHLSLAFSSIFNWMSNSATYVSLSDHFCRPNEKQSILFLFYFSVIKLPRFLTVIIQDKVKVNQTDTHCPEATVISKWGISKWLKMSLIQLEMECFKMSHLQTPHFQMAVFQMGITVASELPLFPNIVYSRVAIFSLKLKRSQDGFKLKLK